MPHIYIRRVPYHVVGGVSSSVVLGSMKLASQPSQRSRFGVCVKLGWFGGSIAMSEGNALSGGRSRQKVAQQRTRGGPRKSRRPWLLVGIWFRDASGCSFACLFELWIDSWVVGWPVVSRWRRREEESEGEARWVALREVVRLGGSE